VITIIIKGEQNAHGLFQQWRRDNPNGYVVNVRSQNNIMLHRAGYCLHLGDAIWEEGRTGWDSLGNATKICCNDREQLTEWIKTYYQNELKICKHCKP
jgi:hypothetical protein